MNRALAVILVIAALPVSSFAEPPAAVNGKDATQPSSAPAGLFVAVGYGGFRGWSEDGENWTAQRWSEKSADDDNIICALTYRDGIFLSAGGGAGRGFILRSVDGKKWDQVVQARWRIANILTLKDRFFAVFNDHYNDSVDGITWTPHAWAKTIAPDGVGSGFIRRWAIGNGAVVFGGDYGLPDNVPRVGWLGGSKEGFTDMKVQKFSADVCALAFANGVFVAGTRDGNILTSKDGLEFKQLQNIGNPVDYDGLRIHDGQFLLRTAKGVQSSVDGVTWTKVEHPARLPRAVAPDGRAIDLGWGNIQFSPDGKTYHNAKVSADPTGVGSVIYAVPLANLPGSAPAETRK